ncbi:MAG: methyltransferase domain-containing protein [Comamonadaceae bacterium]|nr:MAG: methyltransferase domain-containing protein [Comamonadaceae bacterium]
MEARLQRRVQRYGWDLAVASYEAAWRGPLAPAQSALLGLAALQPGERVLDVACGTGLVALEAARRVGPHGSVLGVDLSGRMVDEAIRQAALSPANCRFARMDAESLELADQSVDVALCALGLMYMPQPEQALREMRRVLRPGGRMVAVVWGERSACGWSEVFPIVDAEVASEVCPLFFRLGGGDALAQACATNGFEVLAQQRLTALLAFGDGAQACEGAFSGGPVALAWSRFDEPARQRVRQRYLDSIACWSKAGRYEIPGEFVVVLALAASTARPSGG